ncbi:hypothetical protein [Arcanobacterium buesumense]|uniref:Uncharacterized protein n=1 Tax=Arcanobacterium buesumense TaxID=2722751 RepID=A0A6H2EK62_9ACTO|nr:hypothetical protein [Arcanobacterium buesumense]QJC21249.1 hypothetical protein HC352_01090 [Arcanobacterium buesumense]
MNAVFRRPAQLRPEQLEVIDGDVNIEARSELAYTTAHALIPHGGEVDNEVIARLRALIAEEGVDVIAESWVDSPETSLPGILWRGYLLREWIRRFSEDVHQRFIAAQKAGASQENVLEPENVMKLWDSVFGGSFAGDFIDVIRQSARLTDFLASVEPVWIDEDDHPLATLVTRRATGMARTSQEFREAGEKIFREGVVPPSGSDVQSK